MPPTDPARNHRAAQADKALGHPVRKALLRLVVERGPLSTAQVLDRLDAPEEINLGNVAYHAAVLTTAGLAERSCGCASDEEATYRATEAGRRAMATARPDPRSGGDR